MISDPGAAHVTALEPLAENASLIVSNNADRIREAAPSADVIFHTDYAGSRLLRHALNHAERVRWIHLISTGIENRMFPELIASPVPVTNGRSVFRQSLGEWAIAAMLYFAHDFPGTA